MRIPGERVRQKVAIRQGRGEKEGILSFLRRMRNVIFSLFSSESGRKIESASE
jgi:hypothetical protein